MQSTLNPAHGDPCDVLEIAPDIVLVARAEEELSKLARDVKTRAPQPPKSGPATFVEDPLVPPKIDTAFRATAVNRGRSSGSVLAIRRFVGVLLAICLGVAVLTLKVSGDVAQQLIAAWIPAFAAKSDAPGNPAPVEQRVAAAQPTAAAAAPPPVQPVDATTQNGVAPAAAQSPDQAQMLQSMAHHLANLRQELEELKGQLAEMRASQEQMSRDIAEQKDRTKVSALPPRPAAPLPRRTPPTVRPAQAAAAPVAPPPGAYAPPPQAAAPYAPPLAAAPYVPPPQAAPQAYDPNAPRPPLPVRE